jgi:hypothetical protein
MEQTVFMNSGGYFETDFSSNSDSLISSKEMDDGTDRAN